MILQAREQNSIISLRKRKIASTLKKRMLISANILLKPIKLPENYKEYMGIKKFKEILAKENLDPEEQVRQIISTITGTNEFIFSSGLGLLVWAVETYCLYEIGNEILPQIVREMMLNNYLLTNSYSTEIAFSFINLLLEIQIPWIILEIPSFLFQFVQIGYTELIKGDEDLQVYLLGLASLCQVGKLKLENKFEFVKFVLNLTEHQMAENIDTLVTIFNLSGTLEVFQEAIQTSKFNAFVQILVEVPKSEENAFEIAYFLGKMSSLNLIILIDSNFTPDSFCKLIADLSKYQSCATNIQLLLQVFLSFSLTDWDKYLEIGVVEEHINSLELSFVQKSINEFLEFHQYMLEVSVERKGLVRKMGIRQVIQILVEFVKETEFQLKFEIEIVFYLLYLYKLSENDQDLGDILNRNWSLIIDLVDLIQVYGEDNNEGELNKGLSELRMVIEELNF